MTGTTTEEQVDADAVYSVSEIARITGIHPNTIRKDLKEGQLKGHQGTITRWWKVAGRDLLDWLKRR